MSLMEEKLNSHRPVWTPHPQTQTHTFVLPPASSVLLLACPSELPQAFPGAVKEEGRGEEKGTKGSGKNGQREPVK